MAALNTTDPTLAAIDRALVERDRAQAPRTHLGASSIGYKCERKSWQDFRWTTESQFDAPTLKMFEDGHMGEDLQAARLRMVPGITLATHDENGNQFGFSMFGGHFQGHYDGVIKGLLQAPKTAHIWEHKQSSEKVQARLQKCIDEHGEKQALKNWNPIYYAQAILYMDAEELTRHYLTCSTPGGRHTISCRTENDPVEAQKLKAKAERVIFSDTPPPKLSDDPSYWECKYCAHYSLCHERAMPRANCRTCVWSEPTQDGKWHCRKFDKEATQLCEKHLFMPELLPYEMVDADSENEAIIYRTQQGKTFRNGPKDEDSFLSSELENIPEEMMGDIALAEFRKQFDAKVVDSEVPF